MPRYWMHSEYPSERIQTPEIRTVIANELVPARERETKLARTAREDIAAIPDARSRDDAANRAAVAEGKTVKSPHALEHAARQKSETTNELLRTARQVRSEVENEVWAIVDRSMPQLYANALANAEEAAAEHEQSLRETVRLARLKQRALEELGVAAGALDAARFDLEYKQNKADGSMRVPDRGKIPRPATNRPIGVIGWLASDIYEALLSEDVGLHMPDQPSKMEDAAAASIHAAADPSRGRQSTVYVGSI